MDVVNVAACPLPASPDREVLPPARRAVVDADLPGVTALAADAAAHGGVRPHQLRHFSVTQLLAAGVPEVEVMGRHGHASASSMKPYRHYIRARDRMSTEACAMFSADRRAETDRMRACGVWSRRSGKLGRRGSTFE